MVGLLYWLFSSLERARPSRWPRRDHHDDRHHRRHRRRAAQRHRVHRAADHRVLDADDDVQPAPPEQPTETVAAETPAAQPSPQPTTQAAPPPPPKPGISNVNLTCSKGDGRRVTGRLTFTTAAKVDVILSAGGQIDRKSGGPGNVSMTTSGRGGDICFARVGDQTIGPIPAS